MIIILISTIIYLVSYLLGELTETDFGLYVSFSMALLMFFTVFFLLCIGSQMLIESFKTNKKGKDI